MNQNMLFMLWILVITGIIIYNAISLSKNKNIKEGYFPYLSFKGYCGGCGKLSREDCSSCTNCGFCTTIDGRKNCVPGDNFGPYFREDCADWEYSDPYQRNSKSHKYPNVRNLDIYPYYSWRNLRRGHWGFRNRGPANISGYYNDLRRSARYNRRLRDRIKANTA